MNKAQDQQLAGAASAKPSGKNAQIVKHKKSASSAHRTKKSKSRLTKKKTKHQKIASHVRTRSKKAKAARLMRNRRESPSYHYSGLASAGADAIRALSPPEENHWLALSLPEGPGAERYCLVFGAEAEYPPKGAQMVIAQAPGRARSEIPNTSNEIDETGLTDLNQIKTLQADLDENSESEPTDGLTFKILETAYNYLGVRYRYGGSSPEGFDCSGFVRYVFSENGIQLGRSSREQAQEGMHVPLSALKPGDLIFFNMGSRKHHRIDHVGLYIGDGQFIHAASSRSRQIMISDLKSAHYQRRVVTARRITSAAP